MSAIVSSVDLTPMLRPERMALLELLRSLSADDWERPTECPAWTTKGIALHILGDDLSLLTRQRDASTDSLTLYAETRPGLTIHALLNGFNEQWVTASRFLSNTLVIQLLAFVGDSSEAFYRDVGLDTTSREPVGLFAETKPSPYWQVIAREYLERFIHQSQIRRAAARPELEGELVTAAARVEVHVLAAWMRDYAPPAGSAIAVDFGAVGAWTWQRDADRWSVLEGRSDRGSESLISVAPAPTVALLSRGLSHDDVVTSLTVAGDEALARGALDIVAPLLARATA
jgi:Mycothiol maleylpyruvate isomerase N-terminal domain